MRSSFHFVGSMTLMKIFGRVCAGNEVLLGIPEVWMLYGMNVVLYKA